MSAIDPLILNEVVSAEPVGKTLTSLGSPGSKYLPCDGLTRNSEDWPELATLLANNGTAAGTLSTTTVDISNSRPTVTVLSATANMTPLVGNNGRVFFQLGNSLRVVTDGVLTTTVTLPTSEQLLTMVAYGDVLIAHGATRLHRSLDNGLTWFSFSNTLVLPHTTIRGVSQAFGYDPTSDTLIVINSGTASGQIFRCTNFSTGSPTLVGIGTNPGGLTMGTNGLVSQIEYRCIFYDTAATTWYAVGGVQTTATASDWRHFAIQSTNQGTTWTVRFQDPFVSIDSAKRISHITKASNGEIVAMGNTNRLFHLGSSVTTLSYGGSTYNGLFTLGEKGYAFNSTNVTNLTPPAAPTTWGPVWGRGARVLGTTGGKVFSAGSSAHGLASTVSTFTETTIDPTGWTQITFGAEHAIGIRTDGTLWAWGNNTNSAHGDGSTTAKTLPTQIGTDTDWAFAAAGLNFSLAIKTDGTLWGAGLNTSRQLGDGTSTSRTIWTRIGTATNWLRVYAGALQSWGITTTNELWAWGDNSTTNTILGLGSTALTTVTTPTQITTPSLSWASVHPGYTTVAGSTSSYTLALTTTGELYYWGRNASGFAGSGTSASTPTPTRIGTSTWTNIAADAGSNFGVRSDGTLWAWGNNPYTLGLGTTSTVIVPTQLGTQTNWTQVFSTNSSGLALNSLGQLYGWGQNSNTGFSGLTTAAIPSPEAIGIIPVVNELTYTTNGTRVWQKVDNELQISIPGTFNVINNLENETLLRYDGTTQTSNRLKLGWMTGTPIAPLSGTTRRIYANRHGLVWYFPDATNLDSVSEISVGATTTTTAGAFVNYVSRDATHTYAVIGNSDIWKTPDGVTWTKVGTNPFGTNSTSNVIEAPVYYNNKWWAVSSSALYKSTDLQRWEIVTVSLTTNSKLYPGTTKLFAAPTTAGASSVVVMIQETEGGGFTTTNITNPYGTAAVITAAYTGSIFYFTTTSGIFSLNETTNATATISSTNLPEIGIQQVAFGNSKLVLASGRHIIQSSDAFATVEDTTINSRNLGMFAYDPAFPLRGHIQTRAGVYALPASTTGDILVSGNGINFTRLTKPATIPSFTWASMFISHSGIVVVVDNSNNRIYRTVASDTSTSTFVVPRSVTSEGFQNYVRAKR